MKDGGRTTAEQGGAGGRTGRVGWGPKLFLAALAVTLVFFWWLLIYAGGASSYHG